MAPPGCDIDSWDYVSEPRNTVALTKPPPGRPPSPSSTLETVKTYGRRSVSPNRASVGPQYSPMGHRIRRGSPSRRSTLSIQDIPFRHLAGSDGNDDLGHTASSLDSLRSPVKMQAFDGSVTTASSSSVASAARRRSTTAATELPTRRQVNAVAFLCFVLVSSI